jgi:hypothetical protein
MKAIHGTHGRRLKWFLSFYFQGAIYGVDEFFQTTPFEQERRKG